MNGISPNQSLFARIMALASMNDHAYKIFVQKTRSRYSLDPPSDPSQVAHPDDPTLHPNWPRVYDACAHYMARVLSEETIFFKLYYYGLKLLWPLARRIPIQKIQVLAHCSNFVLYPPFPARLSSMAAHIIYGSELEFPPEILGQVYRLPSNILGVPVVVAYATPGADTDAIANNFNDQCQDAFGSTSFNPSQNPEFDTQVFIDRHRGMTFPQIFEKHKDEVLPWYKSKRKDLFHEDYGPPGYDEKELKDLGSEKLQRTTRRYFLRLKDFVDRVSGPLDEVNSPHRKP